MERVTETTANRRLAGVKCCGTCRHFDLDTDGFDSCSKVEDERGFDTLTDIEQVCDYWESPQTD